MKYATMTAVVKGTTCMGEPFEEHLEFTMIPPKDDEMHYGTGYYMRVKMSLSPPAKLIDVRYEKTTDIEVLADRFIESWYGENAKEISKQFPDQV